MLFCFFVGLLSRVLVLLATSFIICLLLLLHHTSRFGIETFGAMIGCCCFRFLYTAVVAVCCYLNAQLLLLRVRFVTSVSSHFALICVFTTGCALSSFVVFIGLLV